MESSSAVMGAVVEEEEVLPTRRVSVSVEWVSEDLSIGFCT